jgi:hypothetical protein
MKDGDDGFFFRLVVITEFIACQVIIAQTWVPSCPLELWGPAPGMAIF